MDTQQIEMVRVMQEVARIETEIHTADTQYGTVRPEGPSDGRLYERLGIFTVAMGRVGCCPTRALNLIEQMAKMTLEGRGYLNLMGLVLRPGERVFVPSLDIPKS